jgi:hypothetical protein
MWLMVVGSVLISFTGLVIRNMEAATALHVNFYRAIAFMAAVLLVMFSATGERPVTRLYGSDVPVYWLAHYWRLLGYACCRR